MGWTKQKLFNVIIVVVCAGLFLGKLPWVFSTFKQMTYIEYEDAPASEAIVSDGSSTDIYLDRGVAGNFALLESVAITLDAGRKEPAAIHLLDKDSRTLANITPEKGMDEKGRQVLSCQIPALTGAGLSSAQRIRLLEEDEKPYAAAGIASVRVYGGARDIFSIVWAVAEEIVLLGLLVYALRTHRAGESILANHFFMTILLVVASFSVRYVLTTNLAVTVPDENDTLLAGFAMKGGNVLYKDYATLHMPATYWLTCLYALFGARTVVHFRLYFQLTQCLVWGFLFYRFQKSGLRHAVAFISLCWGPITYLFLGENAFHVLPDQLAALNIGVLFLEFMAFTRDHRAGIVRYIIFAIAIFFAVESTVMAIFPVIAFLVAFIFEERRFSRKKIGKRKEGELRKRYLPFVLCLVVPFVLLFLLLLLTRSLGDAVFMTLSFPQKYYAPMIGLGGSPLRFFVSGFANILELFSSTFRGAFVGEATIARIVQCILVLAALVAIFLAGRKYGLIRGICLLFFVETLAARNSVRFHSLMFWMVVVLLLVTRIPAFGPGEEWVPKRKRRQKETPEAPRKAAPPLLPPNVTRGICTAAAVLFLIVFGIPYLQLAFRSLSAGPTKVSSAELLAVRKTNAGNTLFMDANLLTSCYVASKGRLPMNKAPYLTPWYYECFESKTLEQLRNGLPSVILYRENPTVWEYTNYTGSLDTFVRTFYTESEVDGLLVLRTDAAAG